MAPSALQPLAGRPGGGRRCRGVGTAAAGAGAAAAVAAAAALLAGISLLHSGIPLALVLGGSKLPALRGAALPRSAAAAAASDLASPVVAVLGANGRTGGLVVEALLKAGARPRALTRSGRWTPPGGGSAIPAGVEVGQADVTDGASLAAGLAGAVAVVFACAYSRGGSPPRDVDNAGLVRTARVVRDQGIGRLIVVSSCAVTRPYAPVGILLNVIGGGVLLEKLKGESEMRGILKGSKSTYTVVRPGGLKMGPASGFAKLEFNQGDTLVGGVQRADVAAVCAEAALDPENRAAGKTFEMYEAAGRNGLLPWYGESKYMVGGQMDCGRMLGTLLDDEAVTDVPGFLPF